MLCLGDGLMRYVALLGLLVLMAVSLGSTPRARLPTGVNYRVFHMMENVSTATPDANLWVRFPDKAGGSNAIPASYERSVRWIHAWLQSGDLEHRLAIYSPAYTAGVDTVGLRGGVRNFTFGGVRIDSLKIIPWSGGEAATILIYGTD